MHLTGIHNVPCIRVREIIERTLVEAGFEIVRDEAGAGARRLLVRKSGKW